MDNEFIYYLRSDNSIRGIINDEDNIFLEYQVLSGPAKNCYGRCSKRFTDYAIGTGHTEIITNPLMAFFLICMYNNFDK